MNESLATDRPAARILFDLDGTLIDSNYQHALAWKEALSSDGIDMPVWMIHRRIGMSGGMLANELSRRTGVTLDAARMERLKNAHDASFERRRDEITALPGAVELLRDLPQLGTPWAIATSGTHADAGPSLALLELEEDPIVVTSDTVAAAKPDPAIFRAAGAALPDAENTFVVGDAVWDILAARRAGFLPIGVLTGGYSFEELTDAGAYRVFDDVAHLRLDLDLIGVHNDLTAPRS
jgi:HAD superfamily hydrolase (TIGR01549 family)